ncbi:MAG: hypothetical protein AAF211_26885 [Myxococcota bacterium]
MRTSVLALAILAAAPSVALAQADADGPMNTLIVRGGGGWMPLTDHALLGVNGGFAFRTEWNWFSVEFEPVAVTVDAFQRPSGFRIAFAHPSMRFMLQPNRAVSPSLSLGVGGSYQFSNNDDDSAGEYAALALEGRASIGIDANRLRKVRPGASLDFVYPIALLYGTDTLVARPAFFMLNVHLGFNTRKSVWQAIGL